MAPGSSGPAYQVVTRRWRVRSIRAGSRTASGAARRWAGRYTEQLTELDVTTLDDGGLRLRGTWMGELLPASETVWYSAEQPDVEARFEEVAARDGGRGQRVTVSVPLYWFAAYAEGDDFTSAADSVRGS